MIFLTRLKTLLRQPGIWIWTIIFPICLATLEFAAFGKLSTATTYKTIDLYVVTEGEYKIEDMTLDILKNIDIDTDKKLFSITSYSNLEEAKSEYEKNDVSLMLYQKDDKKQLITKENSIDATITESVLLKIDVIVQNMIDAQTQGITDPQIYQEITNSLQKDYAYYHDISTSKEANFSTIYFYSLIAMMCLYATFWGKSIIEDIRADQSNLGIRISTAPTSKYKLLSIYFSVAMILQLISSAILFVYLNYILKVPLGGQPGLVFLTMVVGSMCGIALGMLLGVLLKGTPQKKEAFITIITLALCVFAGLMFANIKQFLDESVPFLKYINPAQLITDCFYQLYYYSTYGGYWLRIAILCGLSALFVFGSILKMRGEKYASI